KHGFTVLTKIDKVEPDMADLVEIEVREFLKGTFLEREPILRVSSHTREGIPQVIETLREFVGKAGAKDSNDIFRLQVDHCFTMVQSFIDSRLPPGIASVGSECDRYAETDSIPCRDRRVDGLCRSSREGTAGARPIRIRADPSRRAGVYATRRSFHHSPVLANAHDWWRRDP